MAQTQYTAVQCGFYNIHAEFWSEAIGGLTSNPLLLPRITNLFPDPAFFLAPTPVSIPWTSFRACMLAYAYLCEQMNMCEWEQMCKYKCKMFMYESTCVYACGCIYVWVHTSHKYVHVWRCHKFGYIIPKALSTFVWEKVFHWAEIHQVGWAGQSESPGNLSTSVSPALGLESLIATQYLVLGVELRSSCLYSQYFTDWPIFYQIPLEDFNHLQLSTVLIKIQNLNSLKGVALLDLVTRVFLKLQSLRHICQTANIWAVSLFFFLQLGAPAQHMVWETWFLRSLRCRATHC